MAGKWIIVVSGGGTIYRMSDDHDFIVHLLSFSKNEKKKVIWLRNDKIKEASMKFSTENECFVILDFSGV